MLAPSQVRRFVTHRNSAFVQSPSASYAYSILTQTDLKTVGATCTTHPSFYSRHACAPNARCNAVYLSLTCAEPCPTSVSIQLLQGCLNVSYTERGASGDHVDLLLKYAIKVQTLHRQRQPNRVVVCVDTVSKLCPLIFPAHPPSQHSGRC